MELLDYDRICEFSNEVDGPKGLVLLYEKVDDSFSILATEKESVRAEECVEFLIKTRADNKDCVRVLVKPGEEFECIALTAFTRSTNTFLQIESARKAAAKAVKALKEYGIQDICVGTDEFSKEIAIGACLSMYKYDILKTNDKKKSVKLSALRANSGFDAGMRIAYFHNFSRFLGDTPANLLTPTLFVEYARKITANLANVKVEVFEKDYMRKNNMNLLLSVAQGSVQDPKLLVVRYNGCSHAETDLCLVGKGVTFDSGGISIKGSSKMAEMKADMLGASSVLATLCLCAETKTKINLLVTVPLTENLPSGTATKPGDVFVGMAGKSVEVDNTDAEGRLILADALTHCQKTDPSIKHLVDVATLTGAMTVALGNVCSGLFCEDDAFANLISVCGKETDDLVWRMPLLDRYRPAIDSTVADIRNIGSPGTGGSCTAAIFLKEFIESKDLKWAHIDIASTMTNSHNKDLYGSGMSGRPVMLLYELCTKLALKE